MALFRVLGGAWEGMADENYQGGREFSPTGHNNGTYNY